MKNLGPISVVAPNYDIRTAKNNQLTFDTRYPFPLIDTTKKTSNQIVNINFLRDIELPVAPAPGFYPDNQASKDTIIYKFEHGYNYVPFVLVYYTYDGLTPTDTIYTNYHQYNPAEPYFFGNSVGVSIDNKYVYIIGSKTICTTIDTVVHNYTMAGVYIGIRFYIFANDLLGNDIPKRG